MKVPGQGLHLAELRMKSRPGYAAVRNFFVGNWSKKRPGMAPDL